MSEPAERPADKLLPDSVRQAVRPGTALLRLTTSRSRSGLLDGAWWPRSRDARAELPELIEALTVHLGSVQRVGLDATAWDDAPTSLVVEGRRVRVDWSSVADDTVLITRGDQDHFLLLVVPPGATVETAHAAMAQAAVPDNTEGGQQILITVGIGTGEGGPGT
ncbi:MULTISPECIES: DUF5994 family protein [unclassified Streptomyces]|uniref:DUF5994 family protein n=1 Tax=unclassified Streptomyces TaxID=2593676 RepID=UPI001661EA3C|nr:MULTISPECIES: DUF5994 family protein [unclassified Streptomyces]MBD0842251.1 hypothetical protein [Streptomyces sp. TRM68416]